jgi:hypothetical protein
MRLRPDKKFTRQQEATKRNEAWRALTYEQQLESLNARQGNSQRQVDKILQKITQYGEDKSEY